MSRAVNQQAGRVLIVEDNPALTANLFEYLEPKGFVVDHAPDGLTGLHLAVTNVYDVIVLDLTLPRIDGLDVCKRLRDQTGRAVPVLMLTARDQLQDKLDGFSAGADDYLVKPFDLPEVLARLQALMLGRHDHALRLQVADLEFDLGRRRVQRGGQTIKLTQTGERLLETLMRAYPNAVPQAELEHAVWGDAASERSSLRTHIHALRRAIDAGQPVKLLQTRQRYGYQLVDRADP